MVWCGVLRTGLVGRSEPKSPGPLFDPSQPLPMSDIPISGQHSYLNFVSAIVKILRYVN